MMRFRVVCLLLFKAIHGIHGESLIIREVNVFDLSVPVGSVAQKADKMIYLTVAGELDGDVFSFAVFAVDFVNIPSLELIQETDSGLCHVIAVRNDIVYLAHMVQVFDETDIEFIRDFHIELLYGTQRL